MNYTRVYVDAIGYELPPVVVTSAELEARLRPMYQALRIPEGQLEALTGIAERRWWEAGYSLTHGAVQAARKALDTTGLEAAKIDALIYAGVCREQFEPATACHVAAGLCIATGSDPALTGGAVLVLYDFVGLHELTRSFFFNSLYVAGVFFLFIHLFSNSVDGAIER